MLDALRLTEHVHGHLGWLAAAALVHPALLLRKPKRTATISVAAAVGLTTLSVALGVYLYGPYRDRLKQHIFLHAPGVGYLFERKEHLAFGVIGLAWAGAIAYFASRRAEDPARLRAFAARAFAISAALALVTAALGTAVAVYRTF
jgi:hypothetical protein